MDLDKFMERHEPDWERLDQLSRAARRRGSMSADEVEELVGLYQRASTHLSHVRSTYGQVPLTRRLTRLVADGHAAVYGSTSRGFRDLARLLAVGFPLGVYRSGRFLVASAVLTLLPALIVGAWLTVSDRAVEASGTDAAREAYVTNDFEAYYSSEAASVFSTEVLTNNIRVGFLAFAAGILLGLPTIWLLVFNGINIGLAGGLFHNVGEQQKFWGLILPHGLLEISAVIVAGAMGLRLGWSLVVPGDRSRSASLKAEASATLPVVLGLVLAFVVAGLIEGFVTPSSLNTPVRIGIGVLALAVFALWILVVGRQADHAELETGW